MSACFAAHKIRFAAFQSALLVLLCPTASVSQSSHSSRITAEQPPLPLLSKRAAVRLLRSSFFVSYVSSLVSKLSFLCFSPVCALQSTNFADRRLSFACWQCRNLFDAICLELSPVDPTPSLILFVCRCDLTFFLLLNLPLRVKAGEYS